MFTWILKMTIPKLSLKFTNSKSQPHFPEDSELTHLPIVPHICVGGSALVQVMACRLIGAKPLAEQILAYCQWDPSVQTSVKLESKYIHENAFENLVWEMAAILTRGRWVKISCRQSDTEFTWDGLSQIWQTSLPIFRDFYFDSYSTIF